MKKLLLLDGVFQGGRSFFGAISTAYLLSNGVSLPEIAVLKMIQSCVGLAGEIPTGLIADRYGRRLSLLISTLLGVASFLLYAISHGFMQFAGAEILLALCLCFWSGAYDAYSIEQLKIENSSTELSRFYHLRNVIGSALIIIAGFAGGLLAAHALNLPYFVSMAAFGALGVWLWVAFPSDRTTHRRAAHVGKSYISIAKTSARLCLSGPVLPIFLGFFLFEVILQPLIYFWQPWFVALAPGDAAIRLGSIYVVLQLALIGSGIVCAKLSGRKATQTSGFWISCWALFSLMMLLVGKLTAFCPSLAVFVAAEIFFSVGESAMKAAFNHHIDSACRASAMSFVGLIVRAGSLISLAGCGLILGKGNGSLTQLARLFSISGTLGLGACLILVGVVYSQWKTIEGARLPKSTVLADV